MLFKNLNNVVEKIKQRLKQGLWDSLVNKLLFKLTNFKQVV